MNDYLLFDLDGTLTDPKEGICTCVQYALRFFGIEEPDLDKLELFIGPPLKTSFMEFYGFDEAKAELAVEKYRERFTDTGIFENRIYKGIPQMLQRLKASGKKLAVASSKPTVFVERILTHFGIREYFDVVVGSEMDGSRVEKPEIVAAAMLKLYGNIPDYTGQKKKNTVMIGDRKFDVEGAKAAGIASVAVAYGYGSVEELESTGTDKVVKTVSELEHYLLHGEIKEEKRESFWMMLWNVAVPVIMFFITQSMGIIIGTSALASIAAQLPKESAAKLVYWNAEGILEGTTANGSALVNLFSFFLAGFVVWFVFAKEVLKKAAKKAKEKDYRTHTPICFGMMAVGTLGMALGLNVLYEVLGVINMSAAYQEVVTMQYAAALPLGLLVNGIAAPIAEEVVFRGVVFNRLKKSMNYQIALIASACIFGMYHGNGIQGTYAFVMGIVIGYCYEQFGMFLVPLAAHMISNITVYLLTMTGLADNIPKNWAVAAGFLLIGAGSLLACQNRKKKTR